MSRTSEPITILIVDDEKDICESLEELFRFQGWKAFSAGNVPAGVQSFREIRPDIVLMDYHMPGVSGIEGVLRIRRLSQEVPIIVLTIEESQEVADEFLDAGASDFALKPVKAPDIVSRIRMHIRMSRLEKELRQTSVKGISGGTLGIIEQYFETTGEYCTVNEIANGTGLAYQTVARYLQHLVNENKVEMVSTYGKVGRPRQMYRALPKQEKEPGK